MPLMHCGPPHFDIPPSHSSARRLPLQADAADAVLSSSPRTASLSVQRQAKARDVAEEGLYRKLDDEVQCGTVWNSYITL